MRIFNKRILFLIVLYSSLNQLAYSQIGNYTKVDKVYRNTYNFLEDENSRGLQQKDKGLYIVYSDRDDNNAYLDALGLSEAKKQSFLTPYFVIDETSDFLELVKFDPSQLGKPKGMFSLFYGDTYNFQDVKNVEYIGWIQKEKLLHFSHSKVSTINLKPLTFYLGANNAKTLFNLRKYVKGDSIFTYKDPGFNKKSDKAFNVNQLVYLYKYNASKTAALIANKKNLQIADSAELVTGWVPAELVNKIGQRRVYKINNDVVSNTNKVSNEIFNEDVSDGYVFMPETKVIDSFSTTAYIPVNVWDHSYNKLLNIRGKNINIKEIPAVAEEQKTFNFHLIFDCSPSAREKLMLQIGAIQNIWLLLNEDEQFKDKNFTFSASAYGCGNFYEFPKGDSFALWLDFLQNSFLNSPPSSASNGFGGIERSLVNVVDNQTIEKNFENNIVIILGEDKLDFDLEDNEVLYDLAKLSSRLIFFQLENTSQKEHQDFILTAKRILDELGKDYNEYISNYVIENSLVVKQPSFISLNTEENNIYLFDAPKNSLYTGGVVFPRAGRTLSASSFDLAIDSLLKTTIASNEALLYSLKEGVDKLGFLRSKPTKSVVEILNKKADSLYNPLLIPKVSKTEKYLDDAKINLIQNKQLELGFLLTKEEASTLIESYKSVIPIVTNAYVNQQQRDALYKKYKAYYKQLNKLIFYKELKKKNTLAELLEIKTGVPVFDESLNTLRIKDIAKKSKLSSKEYADLMQRLRAKIETLEKSIQDNAEPVYIDGSEELYYYLSEKSLL